MPDAATSADPEVLLAKARALESLAGSVKHELASPLNALELFTGIVRLEGRVPDDLVGQLDDLADAAAKVTRLTNLLLELARDRPAAARPVRPAQVVDEVLELAAYLLADVDTTVRLGPDLPEVEVDPAGFRLALVLVLLDALRGLGAPRARGHLRIDGAERGDGRTVEVAVAGDAAPETVGRERSEADLAAARSLLARDGGDVRREPGSGPVPRTILVLPRSGYLG